jgi:hypothetical protein
MRRLTLSLLCCATLSALAGGQATTTSGPATAPAAKVGVLEFRIAPYAPGTVEGAMSESERDRYVEMLAAEGPAPARQRNEQYLWFPLREGREKVGTLILADYAGRTYALLSNQPGEVMLQGTGADAWGLKDVFRDTDAQGRPAVGFEFDPRGAKRFGKLTADHIGQSLAILVNDEVYSYPTIRSVISQRGVIQGNFTPQEVRGLLRALRAGSVRPRAARQPTLASGPATAPATKAEAPKTEVFAGKVVNAQGQPVSGATVGLYKLDAQEVPFLPRMKLIATTTTPAEGTFTLQYTGTGRAILTLVAMKEGFALNWDNIPLSRERSEEFVLTLTAGGGELSGVVVDESGGPIAGAEVCTLLVADTNRPERISYPSTDIPPLVARTDAAGRFTVRALPSQAHIGFFITSPGKALTVTASHEPPYLPYSVGSTDVRIVMEPQATLKGLTVDAATGQAVAGIRVQAMPRAPSPQRAMLGGVAISDAQGHFAFQGLLAGDYTLSVYPKEDQIWVAAAVPATAVVGAAAQDVRIELIKGTRLEVTVAGTDGSPLPQATAYVYPRDRTPGRRSTTNDRGIAGIDLAPGEYRIVAFKEGYRPAADPAQVTIVQGRPQTLRIEMVPLPKIRGVVRDESGAPVADATVRAMPYWTETKTAADGSFTCPTIYGMSSQLDVHPKLIARHVERSLAAMVDLPDEDRPVEAVVRPAVILACTVKDPSDKPISGAALRVSLRFDGYGDYLDRQPTATGGDGQCQIRAVPSGLNADVMVEAEGYGTANQWVQLAEGATGVETLEPFVLQEARESLSGVVVGLDDKPVPGAYVFATGPGQANRRTTTDKDGRFTLDKLVAGTVQLAAFKDDPQRSQSGQAITQTGDTDAKVVLGVSATGPAGKPRPASLVGKALPDLTELALPDAAKTAAGRSVLVCFFDLDQRPSRRTVLTLAAKAAELEAKGVIVLLVQAAVADKEHLDAWLAEQKVTFPVGMLGGEDAKARRTRHRWGAAALPWLILTDTQHTVIFEGSSWTDLETKLIAPTAPSAPSTQPAE